MTGRRRVAWGKVAAEYRCLLYAKGEEVEGESRVRGMDGHDNRLRQGYGGQEGKGGFSRERIREVLEAGGRLPLALRCRVRYFTDGAVLGGQRFVDGFFEGKRGQFGSRRKDGGRRMRGAQWGGLRVLRDLRDGVVG